MGNSKNFEFLRLFWHVPPIPNNNQSVYQDDYRDRFFVFRGTLTYIILFQVLFLRATKYHQQVRNKE